MKFELESYSFSHSFHKMRKAEHMMKSQLSLSSSVHMFSLRSQSSSYTDVWHSVCSLNFV